MQMWSYWFLVVQSVDCRVYFMYIGRSVFLQYSVHITRRNWAAYLQCQILCRTPHFQWGPYNCLSLVQFVHWNHQ